VVNGNQMTFSDDEKSPTNTLIRQTHIHHILRCIAGIKDHQLALRYPVHRTTDFPLPLLPDIAGWETF